MAAARRQFEERDAALEVKTCLSTCDRTVKMYIDTTAPNTNVNARTFFLLETSHTRTFTRGATDARIEARTNFGPKSGEHAY